MPLASPVKPTHKAIRQYYADLHAYQEQLVMHEGAVETAFQRLLGDTASQAWPCPARKKFSRSIGDGRQRFHVRVFALPSESVAALTGHSLRRPVARKAPSGCECCRSDPLSV